MNKANCTHFSGVPIQCDICAKARDLEILACSVADAWAPIRHLGFDRTCGTALDALEFATSDSPFRKARKQP